MQVVSRSIAQSALLFYYRYVDESALYIYTGQIQKGLGLIPAMLEGLDKFGAQLSLLPNGLSGTATATSNARKR
ncbi:MAG: hypothetical protein AB1458_00450 [Bacteroidota bacterium]